MVNPKVKHRAERCSRGANALRHQWATASIFQRIGLPRHGDLRLAGLHTCTLPSGRLRASSTRPACGATTGSPSRDGSAERCNSDALNLLTHRHTTCVLRLDGDFQRGQPGSFAKAIRGVAARCDGCPGSDRRRHSLPSGDVSKEFRARRFGRGRREAGGGGRTPYCRLDGYGVLTGHPHASKVKVRLVVGV